MLEFKKIVRLFTHKKSNTAQMISQREAVIQSGFFNKKYYEAKYSDLISSQSACTDSLEHYMQYGAAQGLDPSELFSSRWYLESNTDVRESGMNPLYHYVTYGEEEGRSPMPEQHDTLGFSSPNSCNQKLWAGFSTLVLPKLEALLKDCRKQYRIQSLWHLARWHYVHGNPEKSLQLLDDLGYRQTRVTKKLLVAKAKCLMVLGKTDQIEILLNLEANRATIGEELPYIKANTCRLNSNAESENRWLSAVSSVYTAYDLLAVEKADMDAPLSLDNLVSPKNIPIKTARTPKVSVIVPVYNGAETIHIALSSLLAQTWTNLEILVVDDASTDQTAEVMAKYCEQYPAVRYICNECNLGAYPTRNRGFVESTGEYVAVHDSDDWSHSQKIESQVTTLINDPSIKVTLTNWVRVNDQLAFVGPWLLSETFVEKNHSSSMISRETIEKIGTWDPVNVGADTEFLWRVEKQFGAESIVTVLPKVPFSLALTLDTSLTQTKATHVKTVHYGLRRLYREAASWWHESTEESLFFDSENREFPCPLGNYRDLPSDFDSIIAADFSETNENLAELIEFVCSRSQLERIALFHWPDYRQIENARVAGVAFELCQKNGLKFTHAGHKLKAGKVYLFDAGLSEWIPDSLPMVVELKEIIFAASNDKLIDAATHNVLIQAFSSEVN